MATLSQSLAPKRSTQVFRRPHIQNPSSTHQCPLSDPRSFRPCGWFQHCLLHREIEILPYQRSKLRHNVQVRTRPACRDNRGLVLTLSEPTGIFPAEPASGSAWASWPGALQASTSQMRQRRSLVSRRRTRTSTSWRGGRRI